MEWHEYMDSVKEQIRSKKSRLLIEDELNDHFEEQTKAFEQEGMDYECAVQKSMESMGDPIDLGTMFDRVHRPKLEKNLLVTIAVISMFTIFLQYLVGKYIGIGDQPGDYFLRELVFIILGLLIMTGIYFIDYTMIGKYPLLLWAILCGYALLQVRFGQRHYNSNIDIFFLAYLFLPLYAGVLFFCRKYQWKGLLLSAFLGLIPDLLFILGQNVSSAIHYSIIALIMIITVTARGWFGQSKKRNLCVILGGAFIVAILSAAFIKCFLLNDYQAERLHTIIYGDNQDVFYQSNKAFEALKNAKFLGKSTSNIAQVPEVENKYILVFIIHTLGILAGIVVIAAFAYLLIRAFRIVKKQKSYLGFIISLSCALILAEQVIGYTVCNLLSARISILQQSFPFLSSGGRNIIVSFVITGLLLSVYRNTDLVSNKTINDRIRRSTTFSKSILNCDIPK